jgi:hypothetical protein
MPGFQKSLYEIDIRSHKLDEMAKYGGNLSNMLHALADAIRAKNNSHGDSLGASLGVWFMSGTFP